jgi:hypothetical protein
MILLLLLSTEQQHAGSHPEASSHGAAKMFHMAFGKSDENMLDPDSDKYPQRIFDFVLEQHISHPVFLVS